MCMSTVIFNQVHADLWPVYKLFFVMSVCVHVSAPKATDN